MRATDVPKRADSPCPGIDRWRLRRARLAHQALILRGGAVIYHHVRLAVSQLTAEGFEVLIGHVGLQGQGSDHLHTTFFGSERSCTTARSVAFSVMKALNCCDVASLCSEPNRGRPAGRHRGRVRDPTAPVAVRRAVIPIAADTMRRCVLPACAKALRMKCTRQ